MWLANKKEEKAVWYSEAGSDFPTEKHTHKINKRFVKKKASLGTTPRCVEATLGRR